MVGSCSRSRTQRQNILGHFNQTGSGFRRNAGGGVWTRRDSLHPSVSDTTVSREALTVDPAKGSECLRRTALLPAEGDWLSEKNCDAMTSSHQPLEAATCFGYRTNALLG